MHIIGFIVLTLIGSIGWEMFSVYVLGNKPGDDL